MAGSGVIMADYKVIQGNIDYIESFEASVSFWLRNGYKPTGSILYTYDGNIMQAVYKEK